MEKADLRFEILSALSESRVVTAEKDPEIAQRYADRITGGETAAAREYSWGRGSATEVSAAVLAALVGLGGVVYAARQFAIATAIYGFYPAGAHGRLVLAILGLFCIGVAVGAILHVVLGLQIGLPILLVCSVIVILGAIFVATYTGPKDMSLEYTQLIPAGAVAVFTVATAALASMASIAAIARSDRFMRR